MPATTYPEPDRGRDLIRLPETPGHKLRFEDDSSWSLRTSRSSSVSSATSSVYSDVSLASSATAYSDSSSLVESDSESTDYSDDADEGSILDRRPSYRHIQAASYELQSKTRTEDTALTLGQDVSCKYESCWTCPPDDDESKTPGQAISPSSSLSLPDPQEHDAPAYNYESLCVREHSAPEMSEPNYSARDLTPQDFDYASTFNAEQIARDQVQLRNKYYSSASTSESLGRSSDFDAVGGKEALCKPCLRPYMPQHQTQAAYSRAANSLQAAKLRHSNQGQQCPGANPRRTKTDASWSRPPLVRQEVRKKTYVQTLVGKSTSPPIHSHTQASAEKEDVAVSLIGHIWPTSERPLQVHDSATGTTVIDLHYFVEQILRRSYASHSTLQLALYYCFKLHGSGKLDMRRRRNLAHPSSEANLPLLCGRRMFLASLMLAFKYLQDRNYSSKAWSSISGLPIKDINNNETRLLEALEYEMFVRPQVYRHWEKVVEGCTDQIKTRGTIHWQSVLNGSVFAQGQAEISCPNDQSGLVDSAPIRFVSEPTKRSPEMNIQKVASLEHGLDGYDSSFEAHWPTPPSSPTSARNAEPGYEAEPVQAVASPIEVTAEDEAACVALPHSPGDMGPVAPPAPHLSTVIPPESSPEQVSYSTTLVNAAKATVHDNDSGYDSSSPRSNCSESSDNSSTQLGAKELTNGCEDQWCNAGIEPDSVVAMERSSMQGIVRDQLRMQSTMALRPKTTSSTTYPYENSSSSDHGPRKTSVHSADCFDEGYGSDKSPNSQSLCRTALDCVDIPRTIVVGDSKAPDASDLLLSLDDLYDDHDLEQCENDMDDAKGLRRQKHSKHSKPSHGKRFYTSVQSHQKRSHEKACGPTVPQSPRKNTKKNKKPKLGRC